MPDFDQAKCAQRRRLAARRDGVEAVPVQLFQASPVNADAALAAPGSALLYAHGTLPASMEDTLARINALLPEGAPPLTADDVYVHYMEAANNNFVPDRYMFMDGTTLRNIAKDAQAGVAFMNSHRDGGLSHPADLPMGKTFAGRFEQTQAGAQRALLGFYMLRGTAPNGANAPTTDDLHRTIVGGTTADTSVGLYGGDNICDVCGADVDDAAVCVHSPGTAHDLTPAETAAQLARGVTKGRASYTLVGGHLGEVSAVYDGAVPGAGFRKTLALARRHTLTRADVLDARQVYARLLRKGDLPMDDLVEAVERGMSNALARFRPNRAGAGDDVLLTAPALPAQVTELAPRVDLAAEQAALAQAQAAFAAEKAAFAKDKYVTQATTEVHRLIHERRVLPAENQPGPDGQPALVAVFAQALADDATSAALFAQAGGTRFAALLAGYNARIPYAAVSDAEGAAVHVLAATGTDGPSPDDLAAKRKALLARTELGRAALKKEQ